MPSMRLLMESTIRIAIGDPAVPLGPSGLHDGDTGLPINDATVQLLSVVNAASGAAVTGISLPLTLVYLAASNGVYKAKIPATAGYVESQFYTLAVRVTTPGGDQLTVYETVPAMRR